MAGYLDSWSATRRYIEKENHHPLEQIFDELERSWGGRDQKRRVRWPVHLRVGKLETAPGASPRET